MTSTGPVVVIGAGHGGFHVAAALRSHDPVRPITLIGAEPELPYQRPPLSKAFLHGKAQFEDLAFRPESYYDDVKIDLRSGVAVTEIDRLRRHVLLDDGSAVDYEHVVLATGARHRQLLVDGHDLDGVLGLRTHIEAIELLARIDRAQNVVIVGGGFIGLESAAFAAERGKNVVLFEATSRLMSRSVSETTSDHFADLHRNAGIDLRLSSAIEAVEGRDGKVVGVIPTDGCPVPADVVIFGVGAVPNDQLAASCGLAVDNGITVDQHLLTADPNISAIGDCARFPSPFAGHQFIRLESVQNAVDQARCVANRLHDGVLVPYAAVPWFWTEQYGARLQIAGLTAGYVDVEQSGEADKFSVYCFAGSRLLGCDSVNSPRDHMKVRKALGGDTDALAELLTAVGRSS